MANLIGIFGGTFDPIHKGHLNAVDLVCQHLDFNCIHWVLSARPPHKNQVTASVEHRFEMLKLALADSPNYIADNTEITRPRTSYTIDTIATFKQRYPDSSLCMIIGGDSLAKLPQWHRYAELIESVNWVVMRRPGYSPEVPQLLTDRFVDSPKALNQSRGGKIWCFGQSDFDVSSTQLRAALSHFSSLATTNQSTREGVPDLVKQFIANAVINYIREQQLYKIGP